MECIIRCGASGKQYLFLHISCLILQWADCHAPAWGIDWLESIAEYGGKMTDARGVAAAIGHSRCREFAGSSGICA
jgi:hypothetical protein